MSKCNHDCFHCPYDDCVVDDELTAEERTQAMSMDMEVRHEKAYVKARGKYAYSEKCRAAQKRYNSQERVKAMRRENTKRYYAKNREKILEKRKKYYEENKDKVKERLSEYYAGHKDDHKRRCREYYQRTKEQRQEYARRYRMEHKEEIAQRAKERRAQRREPCEKESTL